MITLAQLEQEVARRTGPFFQAAQDSSVPTSSTTIAAYMPTLKTSAVLGGPENLWLLRRGIHTDGTPVSTYTPVDRTRMVQSFDPGSGRVQVDRNWYNPMSPDELADFTHLHPTQELRQVVLAGLRRCFLQDIEEVDPNLQYGPIDLTAQFAWVTDPRQVVRVQYGWLQPGADAPFSTTMQQGHVLLGDAWGGNAASSVWVTFQRPAWSLVNGVDSDGPDADSDQLDVDLDYAASAGHIEAWHLFPAHLFAAAAGSLQATQEMAAREFTRQSMIWGPAQPQRYGFTEVVRMPL